jgi:Kef-type K+ transport system membrane component KefB
MLGTLVSVAIVLAAAHLGGEVARWVGQPAVIGQLLAGVVIGPTVLGSRSDDLLSDDTLRAVRDLGTVGLVAFAFSLGARLERAHLPRPHHFAAMAGAVFGVPFVAGLAVAFWLFDGHDVADGTTVDRLPFVLFVGAAISITAFPVLARLLEEHGLVGTPVGSLSLSCAAVNDLLSWIALALALAANSSSSGAEVTKLVGAAVGLVAVLALLATLADRHQRAHGALRLPWWIATLVVGTGLAGAAFATNETGLHYVFGAFAFGVLFARPSLAPLAEWPIRVATWLGLVLLPLYLVLPGATTDFRDLDVGNGGEILVVLVVAAASKLLAGTVSARTTGLSRHDALSVGVLLNTRGLVELVALGIGLSAGLLDGSLFAVLVIMAVVTTVATSPILRILGFDSPLTAKTRRMPSM